MKPVNNNQKTPCTPTSSNCVKYEGPKLCCIKDCTGDSVSDVIFKLSEEVCHHHALLDLSMLDLGDLTLPGDGSRTVVNVLQAIINRIQLT
jgi:hypothetical protein